jgi:hypothetical protein
MWEPKGKWAAIKANVGAERQMGHHKGGARRQMGHQKGIWVPKGIWGAIKAYGVPKGIWVPEGKWGAKKDIWAPKGKWGTKKANGCHKRQMGCQKGHWGAVRLWISARWGRDTSVLRLMAAHCFGLAPGGGARLEYCVKYATCSCAVCNMLAQKSQLAGLQATQLAGAML